jgi:hypothetical protein
MDALVPALRPVVQEATDGPRAAGIVGLGLRGIVLPLPVRFADGMDGGEVDDVEAHLLDAGQALGRVVKRGVLIVVPRRARKKLVPGRVAGQLRIHQYLIGGAGGLRRMRGVATHQFGDLVAQRRRRVAVFKGLDVSFPELPVVRWGILRGLGQQVDPNLQLTFDLGRRFAPLHPPSKLILPRREAIDPCPNAVQIGTNR